MSDGKDIVREGAILMGRFDCALDGRSRFTVPAQWRQVLGGPEYLFVMPDPVRRCLNIIPVQEMSARLAKLREKALFDPRMAEILHTIGENSEQVALDVQGRIRVSDRLLEFIGAKEKKDGRHGGVTLVGAIRKIEIWRQLPAAAAESIDQAAFGAALQEAGF